jgi:6-phosphofructokinase
MTVMNNNFLITMSGGTTQVINATMTGIISEIRRLFPGSKIYGGYPGITGVMNENLVELTSTSKTDLLRIFRTPASGLIGTTRVKPVDRENIEDLCRITERYSIGYFLNIGGNGTIRQTKAISQYADNSLKVAALPKTVDNDLGDDTFEDVLFTPGFPSCANYWRHKTHVMNFENLGAFAHDRVLVAQTFGRKTGFLAGCARLADPERKLPLLILLPEDQRSLDEVLGAIENRLIKHNRAIVVMCEGYDVERFDEKLDPSGQIMYGSSSNTSAQLLVNACVDAEMNARGFIPGFDQRSEMRFSSTIDLEAAYGVGKFAVKTFKQGGKSFFSSVCRSDNSLNEIGFKNISLNEIEDYSRDMPSRWIDHGNFDVTCAYDAYVEPLIGLGQVVVPNDLHEVYFGYPDKIHGKVPADVT